MNQRETFKTFNTNVQKCWHNKRCSPHSNTSEYRIGSSLCLLSCIFFPLFLIIAVLTWEKFLFPSLFLINNKWNNFSWIHSHSFHYPVLWLFKSYLRRFHLCQIIAVTKTDNVLTLTQYVNEKFLIETKKSCKYILNKLPAGFVCKMIFHECSWILSKPLLEFNIDLYMLSWKFWFFPLKTKKKKEYQTTLMHNLDAFDEVFLKSCLTCFWFLPLFIPRNKAWFSMILFKY